MSDVLKVLMMGGQRAGKSSILAGLVDTMTNGKVKDIVSINDITEGNLNLDRKIENLKTHLKNSLNKVYLIDDNDKTNVFDDYTLQISVPNTNSKMNIVFTDVAGEFYDQGRMTDKEIREKIRTYDVFIIAVDTPFLMEAANHDNKLCSEAINKSFNHVIDIQSFLTDLDDKDGADAKLVVFVPLKCEKWVREGKVNEVVERVEKVYDSTINALSRYVNVEVDIMPIQTVGNIIFYEQRKALKCDNVCSDMGRRCCLIDHNTRIRFENGDVKPLINGVHQFVDDENAKIRSSSSLMRPNSWFKTIGSDYKPENCDQLAYYILEFYLAKVLFAKKAEKMKDEYSLWDLVKIVATAIGLSVGFFYALAGYFTAKYLEKKFGTFTVDQMENLMNKIKDGNFIKHNCDGIKTIKSSKLYSI